MVAFFQSPVGIIRVEEKDGFIVSVTFVEKTGTNDVSPLLQEAVCQLMEYFDGKRKFFDLPLKQHGTRFQQLAWNFLCTIPYGETVSYKDEAIAIGSPKGYRAVGSANGKNDICIIIPCHRVVNEGGKLGGYAYGLEAKKYLLDMEKAYK